MSNTTAPAAAAAAAAPVVLPAGLRVSQQLTTVEQGRLAHWPNHLHAVQIPARTVRGINLTFPNVTRAPANRLPANFRVSGPPPPQGPLARVQWDIGLPARSTLPEWASTRFVEEPAAAYYEPRTAANPVVIPGLYPWTGAQALSNRELVWVNQPILRHVTWHGSGNPHQLAVRTQLREAFLVSRAGRQPPAGSECTECRANPDAMPFGPCISGGIGQKCNNCLFRGHRDCSLQ